MKDLVRISKLAFSPLIALVTMIGPAYAQNPIIQGMTDSAAINIAKGVIMVIALMTLGGQTVPALMEGDGGKVVKSALGVAILVGVAIKLKEFINLFAG